MSGFSGIFSNKNKKHLSDDLARSMCLSLVHRGSPDVRVENQGNIILGFTGFNTVGLSSPAEQPLHDAANNITMVADGSIYNYKKLRAALEAEGHVFKSQSDIEVIIPLYLKHGIDCLKLLDGKFAIALYDGNKQQLFLVRDRTGEKPLYYTWFEDTLFFASEIKSFWNIEGFSPPLSREGVFNYFQFTQCPAPFSMYEGINKIMPAHYVAIDGAHHSESKAYWKIDFATKTKLSFEEAQKQLEVVLKESIGRTLVSDIPVGALLSGGVDSSTIVGIMDELTGKQIETFTIGMAPAEGKSDPEFSRAERIATRYNTKHHVLEYKTTGFKDFVRALRFYDEPVGIFDSIQQMYLMRFVKDHVRVILSGTAADTILAAPAVFPDVRDRHLALQQALAASGGKKQALDRLLADTQNAMNIEQAETFMSDDMVAFAKQYDTMGYLAPFLAFGDYNDIWGAELFIEFFVYFSHISTFNDNIGMTNGVEVRCPFVDHHLLEFSATLPESYILKMNNGVAEHKIILKEIAKQYMPEDMVYARKIMCGEYIDWSVMLKTEWRDDAMRLFELTKTELSYLISYDKLIAYWELFLTDKANFRQRYNFLRIIMFLIWYEETYKAKRPKLEAF